MRGWSHLIGVVVLTTLAAACSAPSSLVTESLDPVTGVTVLRGTAPIVLYHDNSGYAAHARDYVYLGPVEVNRMGSYSYYLWMGIWSTMRYENPQSEQRDGFESVVLFVDGEPLPLEFAGWTLDAIGVTEPVYVKPVASAADAYYQVTIDQIRLIAEASDIQLRAGTAKPRSYALWESQGAAYASLRAFLDQGYD